MDHHRLAYVYPPDLQLSFKHRQANRIFRKLDLDDHQQPRCECCGRYIGQQSDENWLCYHPVKTLEFLGAGVPLLFIFIQNMCLVLLLLISIVTFFGLTSNVLGDNCIKSQENCSDPNVFNLLSVINKLLSEVNLSVQISLILVMTLSWVFVNQIFIYRSRQAQYQADLFIQTPSDYAILIDSLPQLATIQNIEQMIKKREKQFNKQQNSQTEQLAIQEVLMLYKLQDYFAKKQEQQLKFKQFVEEGILASWKQQNIPKPQEVANVAIVVFKKQKSKLYFQENSTLFSQFKSAFCNWGVELSKYTVLGQSVHISRAPEPDDILWKNIGKPQKIIIRNKIISFTIGIILLLSAGIIQYLLARWQANLDGFDQTCVSIFSSILQMLGGFFITQYLVWATRKQGNLTSTRQNYSLNTKIVYFQFFHAGIFYSLANLIGSNATQLQKNFSFKITVFMAINAISPTITTLIFDYFQVSHNISRFLLKNNLKIYSQKQTNHFYEMSDSQIPFKYAYVIKTLWLTFFYSPFVPVVSIISLFGLGFYYFAVKFLFRYSYKIPSIHSNQINRGAIRLSYFAPLALNVGQLMIFLYMQGDVRYEQVLLDKVLVYLSLALAAAFVIVPWYTINQQLFDFHVESNQQYQDNQKHFQITYRQAVPFYEGDSMKQRDCHFVRHQCKKIEKDPAVILATMIKDFIPLAIGSERKLMSTQL